MGVPYILCANCCVCMTIFDCTSFPRLNWRYLDEIVGLLENAGHEVLEYNDMAEGIQGLIFSM